MLDPTHAHHPDTQTESGWKQKNASSVYFPVHQFADEHVFPMALQPAVTVTWLSMQITAVYVLKTHFIQYKYRATTCESF